MNRFKLIFLLSFPSTVFAAPPKNITLATTNWCPYACDQSATGPGFIVEVMKDVFKQEGIDIEVKSYPWARAIEMVKTGAIDGLLTAASTEMEGLKSPQAPTGTYKVCFFSTPKKNWVYENLESLKHIRLGVIAQYSYGEPVDSYIKSKPSLLVTKYTSDGLSSLLELLKSGHIDAVIDDENVVNLVAQSHKFSKGELKKSGCLDKIPFFTAFNPQKPWLNEVIAILDRALSKPKTQQLYQKYLLKYTSR